MKKFLNIFAAIVALGILTGCYEEIDLVDGTAYTAINYTTNDNEIADINTSDYGNMHVIGNTYTDGVGKVVIKGKMTWVGSSSMEVCVDTYVETLAGQRTRINNAHFMMVALDENDKPMQVPRLILQNDDEELAWSHGEERRRIRNQRRKDKLDGI